MTATILFSLNTDTPKPVNLCYPSPCGPNSECRVINESPSCSCLPEYKGSPPNCRPECISNNDCSNQLACMNLKCKNPCTDACGENTDCNVVNHAASCLCRAGYTGDPFVQCTIVSSRTRKLFVKK